VNVAVGHVHPVDGAVLGGMVGAPAVECAGVGVGAGVTDLCDLPLGGAGGGRGVPVAAAFAAAVSSAASSATTLGSGGLTLATTLEGLHLGSQGDDLGVAVVRVIPLLLGDEVAVRLVEVLDDDA